VVGKLLITLALIVHAGGSIVFDWNASHVFNPGWPPHARFHEVASIGVGVGISAIALWLLWRRSAEPLIGAAVAALVPVVKTVAFLLTFAVEGARYEDHPGDVPLVAGIPTNLLHPALTAVVGVTGFLRSSRNTRSF
jgi:hypothetical protein